jgi:hypothetical protein
MSDEKLSMRQIQFRAGYLAHGDAQRAFKDAGYAGEPVIGSQEQLRKPYMVAALQRLGRATEQAAIGNAVAATQDALQSREGLCAWLCGVIKGAYTEQVIDEDGIAVDLPTPMRDRLAAAKLLAQVQGLAAPAQLDVTSKGAPVGGLILVAPGNGRSTIPLPPGVTVVEHDQTTNRN